MSSDLIGVALLVLGAVVIAGCVWLIATGAVLLGVASFEQGMEPM